VALHFFHFLWNNALLLHAIMNLFDCHFFSYGFF
jgi:hypothetical protein